MSDIKLIDQKLWSSSGTKFSVIYKFESPRDMGTSNPAVRNVDRESEYVGEPYPYLFRPLLQIREPQEQCRIAWQIKADGLRLPAPRDVFTVTYIGTMPRAPEFSRVTVQRNFPFPARWDA